MIVTMAERALRNIRSTVVAGMLAVSLVSCSSAVVPDPSGSPSGSASATGSPSPSASAVPTPVPSPSPAPTPPAFDRTRLSIDDPASLWVVSNKLRPLGPVDYAPADLGYPPLPNANGQPLRAATADAVVAMFAAAESEGAGGMRIQSAYRSYGTQAGVYSGYVSREGQASADAQSARAGHSEHQTGLALDISAGSSCILAGCFGDTAQGVWLAGNAWRFGFLLRYPADKVAVTGFMYEPWHFRFVGVELSTELHSTGATTLEEFFDLPPAPDYAG